MLAWLLSMGALPIAGALMARTLFVHVPGLLRLMFATHCDECGCWWSEHELYCEHHSYNDCKDERCVPPPVPVLDHDAMERAQFIGCPSAFWLEPTRWERPTWPATPTLADLQYNHTPEDMALAYLLLAPEERAKLDLERDTTPLTRPLQISSKRAFDRRY